MKDEKDPDVLKPPYEKPELMSLNGPVKGSGLCADGSNDTTDCINGLSADAVCDDGSDATGTCIVGVIGT